MKSKALILSAIAILAYCAWLAANRTPPHVPTVPSAAKSQQQSNTPEGKAKAHEKIVPPLASGESSGNTVTETQNENTSPLPPKGVRLADEVRLPAVILSINAEERNPNSKRPAPVMAAMRAIVDTFYQDLAEDARQAGLPADEENTVVIQPGASVERARKRADETYRALFGDEAFNRMTMDAALEVRLPASDGSK